jgi:UDP-N-acetylmuramoyl-L-alanyl-D-glutamate--2,6-diaminopimelate ligase
MSFDELLQLVSREKRLHVCSDSRLVKPGDIFVAVTGTSVDGYDFIDKAVAGGAKFVVAEKPCRSSGAEMIIVEDSAIAAGLLAQAYRGNPASKLVNLAVTGTNGKTTVGFMVQAVVKSAGQKCGLIGTVTYDTGEQQVEANMTTPDCADIARMQQEMVKAGAGYMVIEASSHALSQNRLSGINFKSAAFTNLTGDHLDYHKTEKDYLAAKAILFEGLAADATAILNKDAPHSQELAKKTKAKILWYAIDKPADIAAHIESMDVNGTVFAIEYKGGRQIVHTPLLGRHNISNHLAAAGLCLGAGFDLKTVADGLSTLKLVPGRLDKVEWDGQFSILVDYAHTDDALKNVLTTLKPLCKGNLILVFGCGGDRDRTKRPRMADAAERLADFIIVTSDNPRTERPEAIIEEIITGFKNPRADTIRIEPDRKKAIKAAIEKACKNDIILIAGKGHETYQIIGKEKNDFNDKQIAWEYLKKLR